jgi:alkylhydroperoxidase family enzyme
LNCKTCARGARDALTAEGWTDADVDQMIAHLSSPRLSEFECGLVRFARETVRYRVDRMHARCKALFAGLSREQAIEVVGFCALANSLARLTFVLER